MSNPSQSMRPTENVPATWLHWVCRWSRWDWFALILPLLSMSPLLVAEGRFLWGKQHMQFYPLALAAVAWFIAQEGDASAVPNQRRLIAARAGSWVNLLFVAMASLLHSSWLAHWTCIQVLLVWMLGKFGNLSILRTIGICGLAMITLPFPFNGDQDLVHALQRISSLTCSRMMDAIHILHVRTGNVIELVGKKLFVEEACSGVDSQYALMAVAGVLLLVGRASAWVSILTIVTVPIWAILGNILRIFSIVLGFETVGIDLSTGMLHTLLGLASFALAAWAHWSSVQFLNWLEWTFARRSLDAQRASPTLGNASIQVSSLGLALAAAMVAFAPLGWVAFARNSWRGYVPPLANDVVAALPGESSLIPSPLGVANHFETLQRSRSDRLGQCSRIWYLSKQEGNQTLSIDMPFRGWHPLWGCYELSGWTILQQGLVDLPSSRLERNWPVYEALMRGPEGELNILHFVLIDRHGHPFEYETTRQFQSEKNRKYRTLWRELADIREGWISNQWPLTVQFQLLTHVTEPPDAGTLAVIRHQFQAARERFLEEMQPVLTRLPDEFD